MNGIGVRVLSGLVVTLVVASPTAASRLSSDGVVDVETAVPTLAHLSSPDTAQVIDTPANPESSPSAWIRLTNDPASSTDPDVCSYAGGGNLSVVWIDDRTGNGDVYFTRVSPTGQKLLGDVRVSTTTNASSLPSCAVDSAGNTHIAWLENGTLFYSKVSSAGTILVAPVQRVSAPIDQPRLDAEANGTVHITWSSTSSPRKVKYRRLDSNGNFVSGCGEVTLDTAVAPVSNEYPTIAAPVSGNPYPWIAWHGPDTTHPDRQKVSLMLNCSSINGPYLQTDNISVGRTALGLLTGSAASDEIFEGTLGSNSQHIYWLQTAGVYFALDEGQGPSSYPDLASLNNTDFLAVWADNRSSTSAIYTQRMNGPTSTKVGNNCLVSDAISNARRPSIAAASATTFVAVWDDDRNGQPEIYLALRGLGCGEICDGIDNDGNGLIDEGCDDDGDGYCDGNMVTVGAPAVCPHGGGDCNDNDATNHPTGGEYCSDDVDNDGDGQVDCADADCICDRNCPLGARASAMAKQLLAAITPYLWGGKGNECGTGRFLPAAVVASGYSYWQCASTCGQQSCDSRLCTAGSGIDCSGLTRWSYNTAPANGGTFTLDGANAQFLHCSDPIPGGGPLVPGDLVFLGTDSWKVHVGMYVGFLPGGNDVIEAPDCNLVVRTTRSGGFPYQRRVRACSKGLTAVAQSSATMLTPGGESPVTLTVEDPEGYTINADTYVFTEREVLREVTGQLYYSLSDFDGDGAVDEIVVAPALKSGQYLVQVVPKPGMSPTARFRLATQTESGERLTLATDVPIAEIPAAGYLVQSDGSQLNAIPAEVTGMVMSSDKVTLAWDSAVSTGGPGTLHDVLRGLLQELPVGAGGSELCLGSITDSQWPDAQTPPANQGFWYLVRGRNAVGTGTYGRASSGAERVSSACP